MKFTAILSVFAISLISVKANDKETIAELENKVKILELQAKVVELEKKNKEIAELDAIFNPEKKTVVVLTSEERYQATLARLKAVQEPEFKGPSYSEFERTVATAKPARRLNPGGGRRTRVRVYGGCYHGGCYPHYSYPY